MFSTNKISSKTRNIYANTMKIAVQNVYETEHLPYEFQIQKKSLILFTMKRERKRKKKLWKIVHCEYALNVDGERVFADY